MRIFQHLFDEGWLKEGDLVADPFGGIGVTALAAASFGCPCILVELEEKFVDLAEQNFELHREQWEKMGKPHPIILQGDSRQFSSIIREVVDAIVTSPPFGQAEARDRTPYSGGRVAAMMKGAYIQSKQGNAEGQIGAMKEGKLDEVVAVITSPPFVGSTADTPRPAKLTDEYVAEWGHKQLHGDYGQSQGQLGGMPEGNHGTIISGIITSPPYAESLRPETEEQTRRKQERITKAKTIHNGRALEEPSPGKAALGSGYGVSEGQLGAMKEGDFGEVVNGVITSPPYPEVISTGERRDVQKAIEAEKRYLEAHPELKGKRPELHLYGDSKGQIGHLREGDFEEVKAVITSPPYARVMERNKPKHPNIQEADEQMKKLRLGHIAYGESEDNLGNLPEGDYEATVQGIVTSPPYVSGGHHPDQTGAWGGKAQSVPKELAGYGKTKGQLGTMSEGNHEAVVNGIVTSPPFETSDNRGGTKPYDFSPVGGIRTADDIVPDSLGQLGQLQGDVYWAAVAQVYQQCWKVLKPSGVMVVVVKDFVRDKKRVPLCDQTLELLEAVGFKPLERIKAWLVKSEYKDTLFDDDTEHYFYEQSELKRRKAWEGGEKHTTYQPLDFVAWLLAWKQRKKASFFRHLAELKGSPRIDWEEVLIFQKPE